MSGAFTARHLSQHDVVTVEPTMPLIGAARLMRDQHVGCLVVVRHTASHVQAPIGILTDRDIVVSAVAAEADLSRLRVGDVIDARVVAVRETDTLPEILAIMQHAGVRRVMVTGDRDRLVGLLSLDDVLLALTVSLQQVVETVRTELRSEPQRRP